MNAIRIDHNPDAKLLADQSVKTWPIWEKEVSEFPWHYDEMETCYLAGR